MKHLSMVIETANSLFHQVFRIYGLPEGIDRTHPESDRFLKASRQQCQLNQNQNELYCQVCLHIQGHFFVTEATAVQQNDSDRTKTQIIKRRIKKKMKIRNKNIQIVNCIYRLLWQFLSYKHHH